MEIGMDISAITRKSADLSVDGVSGVSGLRRGADIYLPPSTVLNAIGTYCHEAGHVLGDFLSFNAGLIPGEKPEVMAIDQAKKSYSTIHLNHDEYRYLSRYTTSDDIVPVSDIAISIANKLLKAFTMGSFKPEMINFHPVTQEELDNLVKETNVNTVAADASGKTVGINSKNGRNSEMPSFITQFCCWQILENTLRREGILNPWGYINSGTSKSPAHQRARNIVGMAFKRKGWRPPSMKDIRDSKAAKVKLVPVEK